MKDKSFKDLMVPVAEYATVSKEATLAEALKALENENMSYEGGPYRHRSLVVTDEENHVVGRVSQIDIMRALEPGYREVGDVNWISRSQLSSRVLVTIREQFQLWKRSVASMKKTLAKLKVADIMQEPSEGEFVEVDDAMSVAMHRIVMGNHHSLLVTRDRVIVGILRSTDVFNALYDMIQNGD